MLLQSKQAKAKRDALNQNSTLALFAEQNQLMESDLSIDLNYLAMHEALEQLARHLQRLTAVARSNCEQWVLVVAGVGMNSAGGCWVLEPAVEDCLRCVGVAVLQGGQGVLLAQATDLLRWA